MIHEGLLRGSQPEGDTGLLRLRMGAQPCTRLTAAPRERDGSEGGSRDGAGGAGQLDAGTGPLIQPSYLQGETAAAAASSVRGAVLLSSSRRLCAPAALCQHGSRWLPSRAWSRASSTLQRETAEKHRIICKSIKTVVRSGVCWQVPEHACSRCRPWAVAPCTNRLGE